jgi:hypothetical protein
MLIKLPSLKVPEELSLLLSMDIQDTRRSYAKVADILYSNKFLTMLVEKYFIAFKKSKNLEEILNYTGWEGFRNRIASVYLQYFMEGEYPTNPNTGLSKQLVDFERTFEKYGVNGYGRSFLLAFYLKLVEQYYQEQGQYFEKSLLTDPNSILNILSMGKYKHEKLDWMILLLWHFTEFWGEEEVKKRIQTNKGSFEKIMDGLTPEQMESMLENFLSYGHAIGQDDVFLFEKV